MAVQRGEVTLECPGPRQAESAITGTSPSSDPILDSERISNYQYAELQENNLHSAAIEHISEESLSTNNIAQIIKKDTPISVSGSISNASTAFQSRLGGGGALSEIEEEKK